MAELRRVPPGRAGRLWLAHRRRIAQRGVGLLDRKLRILRTELQRFQLIETRALQRWSAACREADRWTGRAAVLGGRRDLRHCTPAEPAVVDVTWTAVMGVRYPSAARCVLPQRASGDRVPGSSALEFAIAAHRAALQAAAEHAAAMTARAAIEAEVGLVRRRLTALTERWLPKIERAWHDLEWRLEENERSELSRLHAFRDRRRESR